VGTEWDIYLAIDEVKNCFSFSSHLIVVVAVVVVVTVVVIVVVVEVVVGGRFHRSPLTKLAFSY